MSASPRVMTRRIRRAVCKDQATSTLLLKRLRRLGRAAWFCGEQAGFFLMAAYGGYWFASIEKGWMLGLLFVVLLSTLRMLSLKDTLYSHEAACLAFFPIADDEIFRRVWIDRHRASASWVVAMSIWYAWMVASASGWNAEPVRWLAAPLAAIAHEALLIALATAWMAWLPRLEWDYRVYLATLLTLALLFAGATLIAGPLAPSIEWLLLFIPTGWASGALMASQSRTSIPPVVYAAGVAIAVASFPAAYRKLRRDYAIREVEFHGGVLVGAVPADAREDRAPSDAASEPQPRTAGDAVAVEGRAQPAQPEASNVLLRQALAQDQGEPSAGRIEQLVFARLSARQRVIARMLLGEPPARSWGAQWLRAAKWLVILLALAAIVPLGGLVAFVVVLLVTAVGTPVLGTWYGLNFSGASLTLTTLPVSYGEIARVILFINRIRLLMWAPVALAGCAFAGWKSGVGVDVGIVWGVKAAYLAIVLQPLAFMLHMNERANDRSRLFRALVTVTVVLSLIGIVGASAMALFGNGRGWPLLGAVGSFLAAQALFVFDQRRHERGPLDLVGKPDVPQYWAAS